MFRKSSENSQTDMFSQLESNIGEKRSRLLADEKAWHNIFLKEITNRIEEQPYEILFSTMGRPNASVRQMLAMMIIKDGFNWTDEQLFEQCQLNLGVMRALGLVNFSEELPGSTAYYEFRRRIYFYHQDHGIDLLEMTFKQITQDQVKQYKIKGGYLRMDSKLINSNIAICTRLHLLLGGLIKFNKSLSNQQRKCIKKKNDNASLAEFCQQKPQQFTYQLTQKQQAKQIIGVGHLMRKLLNIFKNEETTPAYTLMSRLYQEQFIEVKAKQQQSDQVDKGPDSKGEKCLQNQESQKNQDDNKIDDSSSDELKLQMKEGKDIPSDSLQSVHDTEAAYRKKGPKGKEVKVAGYHANIAETCEKQPINLVTDILVEKACVSEADFLIPALENSEQILGQQVDKNFTDGGYDSMINRQEMIESKSSTDWYLSNHKGRKHNFAFTRNKNKEIEATDLRTNQKVKIEFREENKRPYRVEDNSPETTSNHRYFTAQEIESRIYLWEMQSKMDDNLLKIRANVEATIHQVFHHLGKNNKTKYRGIIKNKFYVINRALWANFRRIKKAINNDLIVFLNFSKEIFQELHDSKKDAVKFAE